MLEVANLCKGFFQLCIYIGWSVGTELYTVVFGYITSPCYIRVSAQLLIMIRTFFRNANRRNATELSEQYMDPDGRKQNISY